MENMVQGHNQSVSEYVHELQETFRMVGALIPELKVIGREDVALGMFHILAETLHWIHFSHGQLPKKETMTSRSTVNKTDFWKWICHKT